MEQSRSELVTDRGDSVPNHGLHHQSGHGAASDSAVCRGIQSYFAHRLLRVLPSYQIIQKPQALAIKATKGRVLG